MNRKEILLLSHENVLQCGGADIYSAIEEIDKAFKAFVLGDVLQPDKTTLKFTKKGEENRMGLVNVLPAYVNFGDTEIYSCKALGAMPSNVLKGIPRATGTITLFDPETKTPICIMDAQVISAIRTGAVSALAAKKLIPSDVDSICMIGAGVNMRTQLLGLKAALPKLKKVLVYSSKETKYQFAEVMSERLGLEIIPVESPENAIRTSSVIVTCLPNGVPPVVKEEWIMSNGVTIFNIGGHETEYQSLARMDRVIADLWQQAKKRGTQPHALAVKHGVIQEEKVEEIAPIITSTVKGRSSKSENIFFSPTGLGFEDAVVAHKIFQTAQKDGIGTKFALWENSNWI